MPGVVSNATPIIALSMAGEFERLQVLFAQIWVAREVYDEVVVRGHGKPGAEELAKARFVQVGEPQERARVESLRAEQRLGPGEAETIVMAAELGADLVLMDDKGARAAARRAGFAVAGSMRVLELAYERGHLRDLAGAYRKLLATTLWINPTLLDDSLRRHALPPLG